MNETQNPFRDLLLFMFSFTILFFSMNHFVVNDEIGYYVIYYGPKNLFGITAFEGKEPLPLWIAGLFQKIFGQSLNSPRIASMAVGAASLMVLAKFAKEKGLSLILPILLLFSSAYFVFYSRVYFYEIYLPLLGFSLIYGAALFCKAPKKSIILIFTASYFAMLIKRNYLVLLTGLPMMLLVEIHLAKGLKDYFRERANWLLYLAGVFAGACGYAAGLGTYFLAGRLGDYFRFNRFISKPPEAILHALMSIPNPYSLQILWIDVGPGVLIGLAAVLMALMIQKRGRLTGLGLSLACLPVFLISIAAPKWLFARYLIPIYPVFLYALFTGLSQITSLKWRRAMITLIAFLQLWPLYRTTLPLLYNLQALHWTPDETEQHIIKGPWHGYPELENYLGEISKKQRVEISCEGLNAGYRCMLIDKLLFQPHPDPKQEIRHFRLVSEDSLGTPLRPSNALWFNALKIAGSDVTSTLSLSESAALGAPKQ